MPASDENIRTGYQSAVDLWGILVNSQWSRFNAMVVANSIIITAVGFFLTADNILYPINNNLAFFFVIFLSLLGLIMTIFWQSLMHRDAINMRYYAASARRLESNLPPVNTVFMGSKLAHGDMVYGLQMKGLSTLDAKKNIDLIIWLFRIAYLVFIFAAMVHSYYTCKIEIAFLVMIVVAVLFISAAFIIGRRFSSKTTETLMQKLESLQEMRDQGYITNAEFDSKRADILSKM